MNTEGVTAGSWMVGIMLAGFAGVLLGPIVGLQEFQFTLLLVGSFVAVVIGRMSSLPITFIGAIAIGLLQQIWVKYQPDHGLFSIGVAASIPFIVMLVFLIYYSFTSSGLRRESFEVDRRTGGGVHGDAPPLPLSHGLRRLIGPVIVAVVLALLPVLFNNSDLRPVLDRRVRPGVALAIIFLSFTLVTGEGGMISLCQITLAGHRRVRAPLAAGRPKPGSRRGRALLVGALVAVPFGFAAWRCPASGSATSTSRCSPSASRSSSSSSCGCGSEFDNFGAGRRPREAVRHRVSTTE